MLAGNGGDTALEKSGDDDMKDVTNQEKGDLSGNGGDTVVKKSGDESMEDANDGYVHGEEEDGENAMAEPSPTDIRSIEEKRYHFCGGSARWMLNYHLECVDENLSEYWKSTENRLDILNGEIGPTSRAETNYSFDLRREK